MSARIFSASAEPRADTDVHPAWCRCSTCATPWDAAHCGLRSYSNIVGLILAFATLAAIALVIG